jgi:hypothetical protein
MKKIARVFPRRTNATPTDSYAFVGEPIFSTLPDDIAEVHVSVTFTCLDLFAQKSNEYCEFSARNDGSMKFAYADPPYMKRCWERFITERKAPEEETQR